MKIATYNVNGVNGRLSVLLRWLEQAAPDVVCLQELKAPQEKFPEAAIRDAGYGAIWQGQKSWNGVAILARDLDVYKPERWLDDALFRPEVREAYARLVAQGWTDAARAPSRRADLHVLGLLPKRLWPGRWSAD
jgi:exonuclease III